MLIALTITQSVIYNLILSSTETDLLVYGSIIQLYFILCTLMFSFSIDITTNLDGFQTFILVLTQSLFKIL